MKKKTSNEKTHGKLGSFDEWRLSSVGYVMELMDCAKEGQELDSIDMITLFTMLVTGMVMLHKEVKDIKKVIEEEF